MGIYKLCTTCRKKVSANTGCRSCIEEDNRRRNKDYDYKKRNSNTRNIYTSKEWVVVRQQVLRRFNYLDLYELKVNKRFVRAEMVHHIYELTEREDLAYRLDNLIPLSNKTHAFIHSEYSKSNKNKINMQKELLSLINAE